MHYVGTYGVFANFITLKCGSPAGQPLIYPRNDLTYTENFLHMLFAVISCMTPPVQKSWQDRIPAKLFVLCYSYRRSIMKVRIAAQVARDKSCPGSI